MISAHRCVVVIAQLALSLACQPDAIDDEPRGSSRQNDGEDEAEGAAAILDGVGLEWSGEDVQAGTHDVGATFFFQARRVGDQPEVFGTIAFDADGNAVACRDETATSNLEVRRAAGEGFFAAPVFGDAEATCTLTVIELPRCPGDRLTVTFSALLVGLSAAEGSLMPVEAGSMSADTEWVLHGAPPPPGCD